MTHREIVTEVLRTHGPLSSYGVYHVARAKGMRMSPSSARSRIAELERATSGPRVIVVGTEPTPTRKAAVYRLVS